MEHVDFTRLAQTFEGKAAKARVQTKCFWIAGAGRSGVAAARLLKAMGATVFVSEAKSLTDETRKILRSEKIAFEEGGHTTPKFLAECTALVLSPGILLDSGLAWEARRAGIPILSEVELAGWFLPEHARVLGITGTNGKSTTTAYLAQLLCRAGKNAVACGNIGLPFCEAIASAQCYDVFVVELSSYQLESTFSLPLDVTLLLNLQNDHLARYGKLEEYLKAKWRAVLLTKPQGVTFIESRVLRTAILQGLSLPSASQVVALHVPTSQSQAPALFAERTGQNLPIANYGKLSSLRVDELLLPYLLGAAHCSEVEGGYEALIDLKSKKLRFSFKTPCVPGRHNLENVMAASAAAFALGTDGEIIRAQWNKETTQFVGLPHRMEIVARVIERNGIRLSVEIVNDSKATNVESTLVAVRSYTQPVRLLLGGEPKGDSYLNLSEYLSRPIACIYPFGKAAEKIEEELKTVHAPLATTSRGLIEAAERAVVDAQDGEVILLSPACASFDEFKNFEHRGDIFREWAKKYSLSAESEC